MPASYTATAAKSAQAWWPTEQENNDGNNKRRPQKSYAKKDPTNLSLKMEINIG